MSEANSMNVQSRGIMAIMTSSSREYMATSIDHIGMVTKEAFQRRPSAGAHFSAFLTPSLID